MTIKVEEYIRADASNPYKEWFNGLSSQAAVKVTVAKLRMELGNTSSIKWFDGMGEYVIRPIGVQVIGYIWPKTATRSLCCLVVVPSEDSNATSIAPKNC